jgi:hypothetical protein
MIFGIELSGNSNIRVERKWTTIRILLFGWLEICCWNYGVVPISNSCLDVETMGLNVFCSFHNIKLCTYMNSHICILERMYIFSHIIYLK